MQIPTRAELMTWAGRLLIGAAGAAVGAAAVGLRQRAPAPQKLPTTQEPAPIVLFPATSKGHLYLLGFNHDGEWREDTIVFVDELMTMRLRDTAKTYGGAARDGWHITYPDGDVILDLVPHVFAPEQIGRLYIADKGTNQRRLLLAKTQEIVDRGAGVVVRLEGLT